MKDREYFNLRVKVGWLEPGPSYIPGKFTEHTYNIFLKIIKKYCPRIKLVIITSTQITGNTCTAHCPSQNKIRFNAKQLITCDNYNEISNRLNAQNETIERYFIKVFLHEICHKLQAIKYGDQWAYEHGWTGDKKSEHLADRFAKRYAHKF